MVRETTVSESTSAITLTYFDLLENPSVARDEAEAILPAAAMLGVKVKKQTATTPTSGYWPSPKRCKL